MHAVHCRPMAKKKKPSPASVAGSERRHGKRITGCVAKQIDLRETYGINVARLPKGDGSRQAAFATTGVATQLIVERTTNKPLPAHQQREAVKSGRAPLPPINVQQRPTERAWRWLDKVAVRVPYAQPGIRRAGGAVAVAVAAPGDPLQRQYEDWSAEWAALEVKRVGGRVHLVSPPAPPSPASPPSPLSPPPAPPSLPSLCGESHAAGIHSTPIASAETINWAASAATPATAPPPQLPTSIAPPTKLVSVRLAPCGASAAARVRELDLVHIYSWPMPAGWAECALQDLELLTGFLNHFHDKWHERDPRRYEMKTEIGWSGMPGGSAKQLAAQQAGEPFALNAWEHPCGRAWADIHLSLIMPLMWETCKVAYPIESERMSYEGRSHLYGLYGTAWNKVTLGMICPTTLHYDDRNVGLTALLIVGRCALCDQCVLLHECQT